VTKVAPQSDHADISAAERWELIERIWNSNELKRAHRLRELLLYVGTQSVKLGVTAIHEQEIGAAVFGRPDDYDTSLDNIVRVNVTELRKRLGLYFENEGSNEKVLMEIPRGAYIPAFSRLQARGALERPIGQVAHEGGESLFAITDNFEREESTTRSTRMGGGGRAHWLLLWAVSGFALLACCGITFLIWQNAILRSEVSPWRTEPARQAFWSEFLGSGEEVDIVTADNSLSLVEDILKRPVSLDDYLDYKYKNRVDFPDLTPEMRNAINMILGRNLGSVGDYDVAEQVMALGAHSPNLKLASARAYTPEKIKANNVILIGSPHSNPWVELYQDRMDFYTEYDVFEQHMKIVNRAPTPGERPVYEFLAEPDRGYSIVAFVPNFSAHRYALIIAGTDSQATHAAGEWICSSEGLAMIRQKAPHGSFPLFQVVLSSSRLAGTPLRAEVMALRIHPR
jgi:hypothetical protein